MPLTKKRPEILQVYPTMRRTATIKCQCGLTKDISVEQYRGHSPIHCKHCGRTYRVDFRP